MEDGSLNAFMFPLSILSENIVGNLSSTHGPWAEIFLSPTASTCPQLHVAMATFLKSLPYLLRNSSPRGLQILGMVLTVPSSPTELVITCASCWWLVNEVS